MPPAVEPIEFGERNAPREVPSEAVLPLASSPARSNDAGRPAGQLASRPAPCRSTLHLPVRFGAPFLNSSGQAGDALNLALPLASRIPLATFDRCEPYSHSFDMALPEALRDALLETRSRFNFCLGGIGISHGGAGDLKRINGAVYHIARTMFEADSLPVEWVKSCNQMDELWVPSRFNAEIFAVCTEICQ